MSEAELNVLMRRVVDSAAKFIGAEEYAGCTPWVMSFFAVDPVGVANKQLQAAVKAYREALEQKGGG